MSKEAVNNKNTKHIWISVCLFIILLGVFIYVFEKIDIHNKKDKMFTPQELRNYTKEFCDNYEDLEFPEDNNTRFRIAYTENYEENVYFGKFDNIEELSTNYTKCRVIK